MSWLKRGNNQFPTNVQVFGQATSGCRHWKWVDVRLGMAPMAQLVWLYSLSGSTYLDKEKSFFPLYSCSRIQCVPIYVHVGSLACDIVCFHSFGNIWRWNNKCQKCECPTTFWDQSKMEREKEHDKKKSAFHWTLRISYIYLGGK